MMEALDRYRNALLSGAQIKAIPKPEPLLDGWVDLDSIATLYGPSGSLKTFVAVDWTCSTATNTWWFGCAVTPGPVLYIVGEGVSGIGARVAAWESRHMCPISERVHWLPMAAQLYKPEPGAERAIVDLAAELEPALVVVDTFARNAVGAEENSARDVGIVVDRLHAIRSATGACVLTVHHSGKDTAAGMRGSSALLGAMDTTIRCEASEGRLALTVEKQKNHESGRRLALRAQPEAGSLVLTLPSGEDDQTSLRASDLAALETLRRIEVESGISSTAWLRASEMPERTFYEARKRLIGRYLVVNIGTSHQPKYLTADTATALQSDCNGSASKVLHADAPPLGGAALQYDRNNGTRQRARERCVEGLDL